MHQFQIEIIEKFRVECVVCFCVLESSGPPPDESTDIYKMHLRLSNSRFILDHDHITHFQLPTQHSVQCYLQSEAQLQKDEILLQPAFAKQRQAPLQKRRHTGGREENVRV